MPYSTGRVPGNVLPVNFSAWGRVGSDPMVPVPTGSDPKGTLTLDMSEIDWHHTDAVGHGALTPKLEPISNFQTPNFYDRPPPHPRG